jgi:hypothetical protein
MESNIGSSTQYFLAFLRWLVLDFSASYTATDWLHCGAMETLFKIYFQAQDVWNINIELKSQCALCTTWLASSCYSHDWCSFTLTASWPTTDWGGGHFLMESSQAWPPWQICECLHAQSFHILIHIASKTTRCVCLAAEYSFLTLKNQVCHLRWLFKVQHSFAECCRCIPAIHCLLAHTLQLPVQDAGSEYYQM